MPTHQHRFTPKVLKKPANYGVLEQLAGTWVNYNPDNNTTGWGLHTTCLPSPGTNSETIPGKFHFLCQDYKEELTFTLVPGGVRNRGGANEQFSGAVKYDQTIHDLDGNLLWYRGLGYDYPKAGNDVGMASSPVVVGDTVVVQSESQGDPFAAVIDTATGETRWRVARPTKMNWVSPTAIRGKDGKHIVLLQSGNGITALDAKTGDQLWTYDASCGPIPSLTTVGGCTGSHLGDRGDQTRRVEPRCGSGPDESVGRDSGVWHQLVDECGNRLFPEQRKRRGQVDQVTGVCNHRRDARFIDARAEGTNLRRVGRPRVPLVGVLAENLQRLAAMNDCALDRFRHAAGHRHVSTDAHLLTIISGMTRAAAIALALLVSSTTFVERVQLAHESILPAMENIHDEQVQMGLFLRAHYNGQAVVVNDIGVKLAVRKAKWPDLLKEAYAGKLMMWSLGGTASVPDAITCPPPFRS